MLTAKDREDWSVQYLRAWELRDIDAILDQHSEDSVFTSVAFGREARGKDEIRGALEAVFAVWPDLKFVPKRVYSGDDHVVCECVATATQAIPFTVAGNSIQPNGRPVSFAVCDVFAFDGALVSRKDSYVDTANYAMRMGREP